MRIRTTGELPEGETNRGGTSVLLAILVIITLWIGSGCASDKVNPRKPVQGMGYLHVYSETNSNELFWEVQQFETQKNKHKLLYSELETVPNGVLRLALAPGTYSLRITVLNRVIVHPAAATVEIQEDRITPVEMRLAGV